MYSLFCWTVNSRELDVLHVPVVAFESQAHRVDLLEHFRHDLFHGGQVGLSPGDKGEATGNVLALLSRSVSIALIANAVAPAPTAVFLHRIVR
jgi:hypothetical protein